MFNQRPPTGGVPPVDMDKMLRSLRKAVPIIIGIIVLIAVASGSFYTLNDGEAASIERFGSYVRTETQSGLKFKIPFIEESVKVNMDLVRRLEFGTHMTNAGQYEDVVSEALMLTQEENLVLADWVVQYRVVDIYNFLYKVEKLEQTMRTISESSYRRVTAAHPLDDILTNKKNEMQIEIMNDLQEICNKYEMGVRITAVQLQDARPPDQVSEAFLDVTKALEDKNTAINEARRYENERLPVARGEAEKLINEAEAYKEQRINSAIGAVSRYQAVESEYKNQPEIMRTRLYLEMIRVVLPKIKNLYFVDGEGNRLDFLNLGGSTAVNP